MLAYLLKSGLCLAIVYVFYKLLLEKESIHTFKRYYLLVSVLLAFIIPFITFTEYIETTPQEISLVYQDVPLTNIIIEDKPINYVPSILWSIYGIGVLLFSIKFLKNLLQLLYKIKHNTKVKIDQFTHVLLHDLVVPHTFFDYIFLNKQKFEAQQIPKEVLLHEETHAKQKHSLDVLFIEILHILFWFNPFIYFIKHSIKLNHEFLADNAVLKQGIASSTYQNILLAFTSNAAEPSLANAINYSSIKKRFTIMKTHTSKKAIWFRSLIILPLLALLIYGFSDKKVVEKPYVLQIINDEIKVVITKDRNVIIDNETIDFNSLSDKLIEITNKDKIKPSIDIEVEGHLDTQYLEKIKNELKQSNLEISTISAKTIHFDGNNDNYSKINKLLNSINYTADTIVIGNFRAISSNVTVYQNILSNSENIKLEEQKTNQSVFSINKKGEVVSQKMQKATLVEPHSNKEIKTDGQNFDIIGRFGALGVLDWAEVQIGNKFGIINREGKIIVPVKYDIINRFGALGNLNLAQVQIGDKFGAINRKGEIVIPVKYDIINRFGASGNLEWAEVQIGDKFGIINTKGEAVVPIK